MLQIALADLDLTFRERGGAHSEGAATADLAGAHDALETTLFGTWRVVLVFLPLLCKSAHRRIVNVSNGAGSHADQVSGARDSYRAARARKSGRDHQRGLPRLQREVRRREAMGARPVKDGAASVACASLVADDGPTGGIFRDGAPLGW